MCDTTQKCMWHTDSYVWHDSFLTCDTTHSYVQCISFTCVTRHRYSCDVTDSYVWHDLFLTCDTTHSYMQYTSFTCVTRLKNVCDILIHMCDMTHSLRVKQLIHTCNIYLIYMCDTTQIFMWHNGFICVTWLIPYVSNNSFIRAIYISFMFATWLVHMCDMPHALCVTWHIHVCDVTPSYVWHDSFIGVTWLIHRCDMTHSYVWHDSKYVYGTARCSGFKLFIKKNHSFTDLNHPWFEYHVC